MTPLRTLRSTTDEHSHLGYFSLAFFSRSLNKKRYRDLSAHTRKFPVSCFTQMQTDVEVESSCLRRTFSFFLSSLPRPHPSLFAFNRTVIISALSRFLTHNQRNTAWHATPAERLTTERHGERRFHHHSRSQFAVKRPPGGLGCCQNSSRSHGAPPDEQLYGDNP